MDGGIGEANREWADWLLLQQARLLAEPLAGYAIGSRWSAEPTAIAALAATTQGWQTPATAAVTHLLDAQLPNGCVSVSLNDQGPFWPTSLAYLAWQCYRKTWPETPVTTRCITACQRAIDYLLSTRGERIDHNENVGHDTQLIGWPWVDGTHSWVEPTSLAVMALRHAGLPQHLRTVEACELLVDRWLPEGGANYGNTFVLGQTLRPHVLPSALSVLALSRIAPLPQRLSDTVAYLRSELKQTLGIVSLSWTVLALAAVQDSTDLQTDAALLDGSLDRGLRRVSERPATAHHLNMLLLAHGWQRSPLLDLPGQTLSAQHNSQNNVMERSR